MFAKIITKIKPLEKQIETWTDEECLYNFTKFFGRVNMSTEFIQDEEGVITHEILHMFCGNKLISSGPQQLEWPVKPLALPEDFQVN